MPKAKLEILEGAGHLPEVERPEKVNGLLRAFFAE
jgi:pimeloyl-ACP methyl ester carboxylesterase